ncbi:MAG: hypothetical protein IKJ56_02870, partial [Bacteroidales bacterium]|nr:hypothetical protein [Bacteroidales bacterium]
AVAAVEKRWRTFLLRNEMEHAKTVTARMNTTYTPQEQIKNQPFLHHGSRGDFLCWHHFCNARKLFKRLSFFYKF